jgi:hypothetical protein
VIELNLPRPILGAAFSTQTAPVVRRHEIYDRTDRHDARRIDLLAAVIMPLDLIDAHGLGYARRLIKVAQITPEIGIVGNAPQVALEMAVIDAVETDQRREQTPIGFGDTVADKITLARQTCFDLVEGRAPPCRFFVGILTGREAGAINAIVDVRINQVVDTDRSRFVARPDNNRRSDRCPIYRG